MTVRKRLFHVCLIKPRFRMSFFTSSFVTQLCICITSALKKLRSNFRIVFTITTMRQKILLILLHGTKIAAKLAQIIICGITFNELGCDTKMRAFIVGALALSLIYSIVTLILAIAGCFPGTFRHTCMFVTSLVFLLHVIGAVFMSNIVPTKSCPDSNSVAMWAMFGLNVLVIVLLQIDKHCAFCVCSSN